MVSDMLFHDQTLFKNSEVFDFDYVPEEFMFRQEQMKEVINCLNPAINKKRPVNCMLNGLPATGKTTSTNLIFDELKSYNHIVTIHLNCRMVNTTFRVYSEIHKKVFGYSPPDTGIPVTSLYNKIFEKLGEEGKILIVALDDAVFLEDCDEVLYQLLRVSEVFPGVKVGLIVVLSEKEKYVVEDKSVSVFRPRIIDYSPYSGDDIFEILKTRAYLGLYEGVVDDSLLRIISEHAVGQDLRFGIELLRQSVLEAENKSEKKVLKSYVEDAFNKILKTDKDLGKSELGDKEKGVLEILNAKDYDSGDLYKLINKKIKISYSSFYRLIEKLEKKKLIKVDEKIKDRGRTRTISKL